MSNHMKKLHFPLLPGCFFLGVMTSIITINLIQQYQGILFFTEHSQWMLLFFSYNFSLNQQILQNKGISTTFAVCPETKGES